MRAIPQSGWFTKGANQLKGCRGGFTLVELLIGMTVLAVGLLAIGAMFSTGYTDVTAGGRTTLGVSAARLIFEDMHALPFTGLDSFLSPAKVFNTSLVGTLPPVPDVADPAVKAKTMARNLARKWHYVLTGQATGWPAYTAAELATWFPLSATGVNFGGIGTVSVQYVRITPPAAATPNQASCTSDIALSTNPGLRCITVTVTAPGRQKSVQMITLISRL
jgi:prepilin-type N-terminal cleavage/methylation domain-containing protein